MKYDQEGGSPWNLEDQAESLASAMIADNFPQLYNRTTTCPACTSDGPYRVLYDKRLTLFHLTVHLNDEHHWNRDRIADWLEHEATVGNIDLSFKVK